MKDNDKSTKSSVNLVEANIIIAVVVSEVNMVASEKDWVVNSGIPGRSVATKVHLPPMSQ